MSTPPTIAGKRLNPAQVAALECLEKGTCHIGRNTVLANNQIAGKSVNCLEDYGFVSRGLAYTTITWRGVEWLAAYRAHKEEKKNVKSN